MPQRFDLVYIGADGKKHRPIMIHRVIFGSIERFIGILIEHYAGKFPTWLAPIHVKILSVSEKSFEYSSYIAKKIRTMGIRVKIDNRQEKIGYKIREAQLQKTPYMLIIGEKESRSGMNVAVRSRDKGDLGIMSIVEFMDKVVNEITTRS